MLIGHDHAIAENCAQDASRKIASNPAQFKGWGNNGQHRRQHWGTLDQDNDTLIVSNSIGCQVAAAIEKIVLAMDLEISTMLNEISLEAVLDIVDVAAKQKQRSQSYDHCQ